MACCDKPQFIKRIEKIRKKELPTLPTPAPIPTLNPESVVAPFEPQLAPTEHVHVTAPIISFENMTAFAIPTTDQMGGEPTTPAVPGGATPGTPTPGFLVPRNPLTPPGYREVLDFNQVQYIQGFYQTQIGHFVRVDHLMGTSLIETTFGFLTSVGINYITVQDPDTPNITSIDIYSIKTMKVFYGAFDFTTVITSG